MLPELIELNRIRLDEDLTFSELAAQVGIKDGSSLNRLLRAEREPIDRTLHKIRGFLARKKAAEAKPRKRRVS